MSQAPAASGDVTLEAQELLHYLALSFSGIDGDDRTRTTLDAFGFSPIELSLPWKFFGEEPDFSKDRNEDFQAAFQALGLDLPPLPKYPSSCLRDTNNNNEKTSANGNVAHESRALHTDTTVPTTLARGIIRTAQTPHTPHEPEELHSKPSDMNVSRWTPLNNTSSYASRIHSQMHANSLAQHSHVLSSTALIAAAEADAETDADADNLEGNASSSSGACTSVAPRVGHLNIAERARLAALQRAEARRERQQQASGPFRSAHAKLLADRRRKGLGNQGVNADEDAERDGKRGANELWLDEMGSDANLRKIGRAVLGPAKRPRFCAPRASGAGGAKKTQAAGGSCAGAGKDGGVTRDDLPEIPNVEPRFVEMIMNEMLDESPGVDWDDIAGLHFAKRCVMEAIVWPMKRPDIFTGLRGPPKGLLLFGPPGTGKTLIGKAIASKSGAKFFNISASSLMSKWLGEAEKMVRALFSVARVFQPSVVFVDEIDSLLTQRTDGDQECSRRIKTEFLVQMDGAGTCKEDRVLVVGATNRPQELDEAARRRLVKRLYIPLPDDDARKRLVERLLQKQHNSLHNDDYHAIINLSKGYSGSDMYALCAEAALGPVRDLGEAIGSIDASNVRAINRNDFVSAARMVRASVSDKDLDGYLAWNERFGSFPCAEPKIATERKDGT